ncbi:MAG: hypothetical protein ETSY1_23485 [Candidatus Entotheonella factor]|uniref:DNA 5'-3' helicase n=1 Tax=Entotheonella factor TaxID=1429438 RepID=W4LGK9_ENTF1|nr:MAG: hypothetical protein ETSY1_23485 [Candidatus Entotheonella factor]
MKLHDENLEQILLGGLFRKSDEILHIELQPEDFYYPVHADIFAKMQALIAEKRSFIVADFTLWAKGKRPDWELYFAEEAEPTGYLQELVDCTLTPDIPHIAAQIKEFARRRTVYAAVKEAEVLLETRPAAEVMTLLQDCLSGSSVVEGIRSAQEVCQDIVISLDKPADCHQTGLAYLDQAMGGGLYAGFTYGFCGAEKSGKTTLAHTISYNLDCPHLYVALEMGSEQIETRNLARDTQINSLKFLDRPKEVKDALANHRVNRQTYYYDAPGQSVDEIMTRVASAVLRYNIKGFIVDYWQLVAGQQKGETEERHLREVAQKFANFARKHGVWCILMAQMNKDGQLFGGNGLKKACDQLYMIHGCGEYSEHGRWLQLDASRYTFRGNVGSDENPCLFLNTKQGPFFHE